MALIRPLSVLPFVGASSTVTPLGVLDGLATHARADWKSGVEVTTRWSTARTFSAVSGQEQRVGTLLRPARVVNTRHSIFGIDYDFSIQHAQRLVQRATAPSAANIPRAGLDRVTQSSLPSDCTPVLGTTTVGADLRILCDTRYRRFYAGARAYLLPPSPVVMTYLTSRFTAVLVNILAVDDDYLDVSMPVVPISGGWIVEPCLDVHVELSSAVSNVTGRVASMSLEVQEVVGSSALPALELAPGHLMHTGRDGVSRPVLVLDHNWGEALEWSNFMDGISYGNDIDRTVWMAGLRPRRSASASARFFSRAEFWPLLQMFDTMRGRSGVFWAVYPDVLFQNLTITSGGSSITFPAQGSLPEWRTSVDAFAAMLPDGSVSIHETLIPVDNGDGTWTVPVQPNLPAVSVLPCVHYAARARFGEDELTENWTTAEVVDVSIPVVELGLPTNLQLLTP